MTIRERMTWGKSGDPVSAKTLNCLFHKIKQKIDEAIQLENGCLTHFEVRTCILFFVQLHLLSPLSKYSQLSNEFSSDSDSHCICPICWWECRYCSHWGSLFFFSSVIILEQTEYKCLVLFSFPMPQAGLGGARDATNILSSSELAASVITTIGEEHLAALGGSLESIAMAKSGIIKPGRPVRWFSTQLVLNINWTLNGHYMPSILLIESPSE